MPAINSDSDWDSCDYCDSRMHYELIKMAEMVLRNRIDQYEKDIKNLTIGLNRVQAESNGWKECAGRLMSELEKIKGL